MKQKLVIYGCGGHARSVLDVLLDNKEEYDIIFVDENAQENETILEYPVVTEYEFDGTEVFFVAIGNNELRKKVLDNFDSDKIINVISRRAYLGYGVEVGNGIFVGEGVHLGPDVRIGSGTVINTGAIVEHETKVGVCAHIAPGCVVCGRCEIGNLVMLGAQTTVIDKIAVCDRAVIGAGALVVKNIEEAGLYVGSPVKKIK